MKLTTKHLEASTMNELTSAEAWTKKYGNYHPQMNALSCWEDIIRQAQREVCTEFRERVHHNGNEDNVADELRAEIEGKAPEAVRKIKSPEITTMCYCPYCGEATRMGRHLDLDCETIQRLKAEATTVRNQAFEEAATACDRYEQELGTQHSILAVSGSSMARCCAEDIRALKTEEHS